MEKLSCVLVGDFDRKTKRSVTKQLKKSGYESVRSLDSELGDQPLHLKNNEHAAIHVDHCYEDTIGNLIEHTERDKVLIVAGVAGALTSAFFVIQSLEEFSQDI